MKTSTASAALTLLAMSEVLCGRQALAAEKKDNEAKKPNILFCIGDDASYHHFTSSGCPWVSTPNISRIAREGIQFDNCYTPNAKSAPSRAIVLTGCYSWQLGEAGNHISNFPPELKVFTDVLRENDYSVAYTGKSWAPGNPGKIDGKPRELTGTAYKKHQTQPPTKGINKCDYARNFEDFLNDQKEDRPWFFWFGCHEPHRKYEYGTGVSLGKRSVSEINEVPAFWPDNEQVRNDMLDYGYEIEYFDTQIGKMIRELEKRGELDNTVIIVTADNGMPFPRCKANDYEYSSHMPFYVMWPDGISNPGRKESSYVSFIDIAPTVLDLAGLDGERNGMQRIAGNSIVNIFFDRQSSRDKRAREEILLGRERDDYGRPNNQGYPIRAIIRDNYLYVWNMKPDRYPAGNPETGYMDVDGSPTKSCILEMNRKGADSRPWRLSFGFRPEFELYRLDIDPFCVNNMIDNPCMKDIAKKMDKRLKEWLLEENDPRMHGKGDEFDNYRFDTENKWNFYERVMSGEIKEPWKQTGWIRETDYEIYDK